MTPEEKAEIKKEIAEAQRILREDGIIASNKAIMEKLQKHFPDEPAEPVNPNEPQPPPRKDDPNAPPQPPKSKWWGDSLD